MAKATGAAVTARWREGQPMIPAAQFAICPIQAGLGILGKKSTLLILRDIAVRKMERFSDLMKSIPGITPRMLSQRLHELEDSRMIKQVEHRKNPRFVRWNLTEKGRDALPILMSYVAFGSKWFAPRVFADGKPREMKEIYPQESLKKMYVNILVNKSEVKKMLGGSEAQVSWNQQETL
jgi:DNA-binding HxlR family transcriptional regulator